MTLTEAMHELGLTDVGDRDQVRRAYLRQLKTRRPETDPDGFQRLRAAYDFVCDHSVGRHAVAYVAPDAKQETAVIVEDVAADPTAGESIAKAIDAEDLDEAARVARARLAFACSHPSGVLVEGPAILELIVRLQRNGDRRRARGITRKLKRWLDVTGMERHLLTQHAAAIFGMLRELAELPDDFPVRLSRAFAKAIAIGKPTPATNALIRYRDEEGEAAIGDVRAKLRDHAPALSEMYARWLFPVRQRSRTAAFDHWRYLLVLPVYMIIVHGIRCVTSPSGAPRDEQAVIRVPSSKAGVPGLLRDVAADVRSLAARANENGANHVASDASDFADHLDRMTCEQAIARLQTLAQVIRELPNFQKAGLPQLVAVVKHPIATTCEVDEGNLP